MGGFTAAEEFPMLRSMGLYAADIRGDGNCLFNALSDQIYGNQNEHQKIRARVIEYMRENAAYYKQFIDVYSGGGVRRNPKRKNAGTYASTVPATAPSEQDVNRVFEAHLQQMARGGTYGDNMEISAFSAAFETDVKIYQRDLAYVITGGEREEQREVAYIAYHPWEHYSSIRNTDGPHMGLPKVYPQEASGEEAEAAAKLAKTPYAAPWMIDLVSKSLPFLADKLTIKRTLEEYRGNVNDAVSRLIEADEQGNVSSAPDSSSVERDPDSEDEASASGPNKKQDRRLSRGTRAQRREKAEDRASLHSLRKSKLPLTEKHGDEEEGEDEDDPDDIRGPSRISLRNRTSNTQTDDSSSVKDEPQEDLTRTITLENPNQAHTKREPYEYSLPPSPSPKDSDTASEYSSSTASRFSMSERSFSSPPPREPFANTTAPPYSSSKPVTNGQRPHPPLSQSTTTKNLHIPPKRISAREKKELKKAAQKAAAKQRKQQQHAANNPKGGTVVAFRTNGPESGPAPPGSKAATGPRKEHTPVLEAGIKVLYI